MVQSRSIDPNAEAHCGSEHHAPKLEVSGKAGLAGAHLPYSHPLSSFTKNSGPGASSQQPATGGQGRGSPQQKRLPRRGQRGRGPGRAYAADRVGQRRQTRRDAKPEATERRPRRLPALATVSSASSSGPSTARGEDPPPPRSQPLPRSPPPLAPPRPKGRA